MILLHHWRSYAHKASVELDDKIVGLYPGICDHPMYNDADSWIICIIDHVFVKKKENNPMEHSTNNGGGLLWRLWHRRCCSRW